MAAVPRELLLDATAIELAPEKLLGVGVLFLPEGETRAESVLTRCLASVDLKVLAWRDVPTRVEALGEIALSAMPKIRQVLVADKLESIPDPQSTMERRLYLARKQFERAHDSHQVTGYVCSLSTQTIVYKAMCSGSLLSTFYPDLTDERFTSTFAIFHQRYATNTAPSWDRAQPGRMFAHNGEINTVWGNRARMDARDSTLPVECKPVLTKTGTDSTSLDETIELISKNGRSLSEAVRMLMPPAVIGGHNSSFLRYHADAIEPWDGPAAIAFSDGRVCGAALDRNGLRPSRFAMTDYGLVVAGSEAGLVDLDPETVTHSGRLGPGEMLVVDLVDGKVYENQELLDIFDSGATYATRLEAEPFEGVDSGEVTSAADLLGWQRGFGYTREDVKMILAPMAAEGKDSVWSMGTTRHSRFWRRRRGRCTPIFGSDLRR